MVAAVVRGFNQVEDRAPMRGTVDQADLIAVRRAYIGRSQRRHRRSVAAMAVGSGDGMPRHKAAPRRDQCRQHSGRGTGETPVLAVPPGFQGPMVWSRPSE